MHDVYEHDMNNILHLNFALVWSTTTELCINVNVRIISASQLVPLHCISYPDDKIT